MAGSDHIFCRSVLILTALATFVLAPRGSSAESQVLVVEELDDDHAIFIAASEMPPIDAIVDPDQAAVMPVSFYAPATQERISVWLPSESEDVSDELLGHLRTFLRCHRTGRTHRIDRKLVAVLGQVAERFPGKEFIVTSGYRVGVGAKQSKHFSGRAVDFRLAGVPIKELRDFVWSTFDHVGVGHYHGRAFLHVDVRPTEPKIGWDQRRQGSKYRYHPWWTGTPRAAGS